MTQVLGSWGALALRSVSLDFQTHPPWHYIPFPCIFKPTHPGTTFRFLVFPDRLTLALRSATTTIPPQRAAQETPKRSKKHALRRAQELLPCQKLPRWAGWRYNDSIT